MYVARIKIIMSRTIKTTTDTVIVIMCLWAERTQNKRKVSRFDFNILWCEKHSGSKKTESQKISKNSTYTVYKNLHRLCQN
jgi:hypothetical protein